MVESAKGIRPVSALLPLDKAKQANKTEIRQERHAEVSKDKKTRETRKDDKVEISEKALNQQQAEELARRIKDKLKESERAMGRENAFKDEA